MLRTSARIRLLLTTAIFATACSNDAANPLASQSSASGAEQEAVTASNPVTVAVIGDTPYGAAKLAEFPQLVALINSDPDVAMVLHAGDIKAGKNEACTDAYFDQIRTLFDTFVDPLIYTPGDNEWTDCHVDIKNNGLYTPTERLLAVRSRFFPVAGQTLGQHPITVKSQASDPGNSDYVENVMASRGRVVFADVNITGSNNDEASWGTTLPSDAGNYPSQAQEIASRARANREWLKATFARATRTQASAVVLMFQADMWDVAEPTLAGYDALVQQIGTLAAAFGKPVLLLEGDSHGYRVDYPFTPSDPLFALHPGTPVAPNVTRIVVEGSDKGRTEYLKLTIDARESAAYPFSWVRVPLF